MKELFREFDGKVDAFGIGGCDLYVYSNIDKRIPIPGPHRIISRLKTPVFDGSLMKISLEPMIIENLHKGGLVRLNEYSAFCLNGCDRFGMAEILGRHCKRIVYGDLLTSIGIPVPITSFRSLTRTVRIFGPLVVKLPFSWLYPTGEKSEHRNRKLTRYFNNADIIAGDFLYILKYRPDEMKGKIVITNTTTRENLQLMKECGVSLAITTTPQIGGRTFGTNVMEAMLSVLINKQPASIEDYRQKILDLNLDKGQVFDFSSKTQTDH